MRGGKRGIAAAAAGSEGKLLLTFSVGNKNDDPAKKRVDSQDAVRFGETVGVRVFETSAKENINVEEVASLFHAHPKL